MLSRNSVTSSLQDFPFNRILRQQTAQNKLTDLEIWDTLLVYLTWLLHIGPGFKTCLVPLSFGKIYHSLRGTLQYVAAPLLVPAQGSSLRWLLDRVCRALTPPICMIYHRSSLTYKRVTGSVTIHNLRTVAPGYGELLVLLVYLT